MTQYEFTDCMGFAGGFTLGMVQAGFKLNGKREEKPGFGVANCEANRHLLGNDWEAQIGDEPSWDVVPNTPVVAGNPPCSGWSVMANSSFRGADSPALRCTWAFVDYVVRVRPQIAVFESVQQAFTMTEGLETMRKLHAYVEDQTGEPWTLYHIRHNAYSVGGAAQRKRYFWLISRIPFGIEIPEITMHPTLNDVIGDLADLDRTWDMQAYNAHAHPWAEHLLSPTGLVDGHWYFKDNPPIKRIMDLIHGTTWGPGEHIAVVARRHYDQHGKLPDSFASTEDKIVRNDFAMGFTTPARWNGKRHARVITGGSLQLVIHPTRDRMITHREAARILGFPDNWLIAPLKNISNLPQTWGKGITTHCGKWIGEWIKNALDGTPGTYTGTKMNDREYDIDVTRAWEGRDRALQMAHRKTSAYASVRIKSTRNSSNSVDGMHGGYSMSDNARRGRPRPQSTLDRDERIFSMLTEPLTRAQLADLTNVPANEAYLSLYRLRIDGRVQRIRHEGEHKWIRTDALSAVEDSATSTDA